MATSELMFVPVPTFRMELSSDNNAALISPFVKSSSRTKNTVTASGNPAPRLSAASPGWQGERGDYLPFNDVITNSPGSPERGGVRMDALFKMLHRLRLAY